MIDRKGGASGVTTRDQRAAPRYRVELAGKIRCGEDVVDALVIDVSSRGAQFILRKPVEKFDTLELRIGDFREFATVVRIGRNGLFSKVYHVGVRFHRERPDVITQHCMDRIRC